MAGVSAQHKNPTGNMMQQHSEGVTESRAERFLRMYTNVGSLHSDQDEKLASVLVKTSSQTLRHRKPRKGCFGTVCAGIKAVFLGTKLNILLLFAPISMVLSWWPDEHVREKFTGLTFLSSLLVLCPLAERLGFVTEELALYTNDTIGGLLNATFGNATELIICAFSLAKAGKAGDETYLRIVQLSLLGSVLGNLLLVLGTAFVVGGLAHPMQSFNQQGMAVNSGLLVMAVASILLPSTLKATGTESNGRSELNLSRFESLFMLGAYTLYLVFQLFTHRHLYEKEGEEAAAVAEDSASESESQPPQIENSGTTPWRPETGEGKVVEPRTLSGRMNEITQSMDSQDERAEPLLSRNASRRSIPEDELAMLMGGATQTRRMGGDHEEEEEEGPIMSLWGAVVWLGLIAVLISVFSEFVVETIEDASTELKIPMPFLSTIVLPIVGNAAEHASAIMFAYRNRMEITLGVAVGSSTQIAVLVIPFTVILAWMMGQDLTLDFQIFEAFTLFIAVLIAVVAMNDGTSNWLKGLMLIVTYIFISAAFWWHYDTDLDGENDVPGTAEGGAAGEAGGGTDGLPVAEAVFGF